MRNTTIPVRLVRSFPTAIERPRMSAARQHPRRDPEGHPNPPAPDPAAPTPPAPQTDPPAGGGDWASMFGGEDPQKVREALDNSRRWESRSKDNFDKAQKWDELLARVNGDGGESPPDPSQLATDLTSERGRRTATERELAVYKLASGLEANAAALTDSRSFMDELVQLDPAAADFTEKVTEAIKGAVARNPGYGAAPSGLGLNVPGAERTPSDPPTLEAQIAAATAKGDHRTAMSLKSQQLAQTSQSK